MSSTLLAVILVCALGVPPDECTRSSAHSVQVLPAPTPMACMMGAEMRLSRDAEDLRGFYAKTLCERRKG
jgi:hypothetical protein